MTWRAVSSRPCVESLAVSLAFYNGLLGLPVNPERPHDKLPYDGAWLMMGTEMVHLMVRRCRLYR